MAIYSLQATMILIGKRYDFHHVTRKL